MWSHKSLFLLVFLPVIAFSGKVLAQQNCSFPPPLFQLTEEGGCGGTQGLPENPSLTQMLQAANGLGPNDVLFGNPSGQGVLVGDIQNETNGWSQNTPFNPSEPEVYPFPMNGSQVIAFANMIDGNVDIGEMVDCINLNCFITSLAIDPANFSALVLELDPAQLQAILEEAGNDPGINYYELFQNLTPEEQEEITDQLNAVTQGYDVNQLAETFYGQSNIPDDQCPDLQTLQEDSFGPDYEPQGGDADLDLFSSNVLGLDYLGNDKLLPSPSAMGMIDLVRSGVDLYNGLPSLGVSLYELISNDLSVGVSLSYNSGGVRLDDYGSDIGANWMLSAGGQISRVALGLPDEFNGTVTGIGMGPINVLKPCVNITGGGINFLVPHKRVVWSPFTPNHLKFYVDIAWGVIPVGLGPISIFIPYYISIEITTSINVRSKPGLINYEEEGLGYFYLNDPVAISAFDASLDPVELSEFQALSPQEKEKYLRKMLGVKNFDDIKFLSPKIAWVTQFWKGIENLFSDEVKRSKKIDTQPDEFFFNFGSYSGKFVFDQNMEIFTIPHSELEIEEFIGTIDNVPQIIGFKVTTPEGIVYHFGGGSVSGLGGVDFSRQTNYVLPNSFTYPIDGSDLNSTFLKEAMIDQTSLPFNGMVACYPRSLLYGTTYEKSFTVMNSPYYSSTWHVTKIESLITGEVINFEYSTGEPMVYYSGKSLSHDFPNFHPLPPSGGQPGLLEATTNKDASLGHLLVPTEWQNGRATLVYSATENYLKESKLRRIMGQRGEVLEFMYSKPRVDMASGYLLTDIDLKINGQFSRGWKFNYEDQAPQVTFSCSESSPEEPVYFTPSEWKIHLGQVHAKFLFPAIVWRGFYINSVHTPIPIPMPLIPKKESHLSWLNEFGSLVQVKNAAGMLSLAQEESVFKAEHGRSFLKNIFEKDRLGGENDFLEITYFGDLKKLPKRFSPNQDIWGYFNDNSASLSLLPRISYVSINGGPPVDMGSHPALRNHFSFNNPDAVAGMFAGHNEAADFEKALIGALESVTLLTGGKTSYEYELNDWPGENGGAATPGAGLRVKKMTQDPVNSLPKITTYEYLNPTIVNRPIRISDHPNNWNDYYLSSLDCVDFFSEFCNLDYNKERYIRTSTSPFNNWLKNKNNYVGYGQVNEIVEGGGVIEHYFTTPEENPPLIPDIQSIRKKIRGVIPFWSSFEAPSPNSFTGYGEPFPVLFSKDWRYGLEKKTIMKNSGGGIVREIHNQFAFGIEELRFAGIPPQLFGLQAHLFQRNYPEPWYANMVLGELFNLIPQGQNEIFNWVINIIQVGLNFSSPFRAIFKDYYYSLNAYQLEQVRLISSDEITKYPDGSTSASTTSYQYGTFPSSENLVYRLLGEYTSFTSNGQTSSQTYRYADGISPLDAKMDQNVLDALKTIGYAGFGVPVRTEISENGGLTGGGIMALGLNGAQFVPISKWGVRDGKMVLIAKFTDWHSSTRPTVIQVAKHGTSPNIGDYSFFEYPLELDYSNGLQILSKKRNEFEETYSYIPITKWFGLNE